jgi:hypothetical protein
MDAEFEERGLSSHNLIYMQRLDQLRLKRIIIQMEKVNLNLNLLMIEILNAITRHEG